MPAQNDDVQNRDVDSCCEWIGPDDFNAQIVSARLKTINWHFISERSLHFKVGTLKEIQEDFKKHN